MAYTSLKGQEMGEGPQPGMGRARPLQTIVVGPRSGSQCACQQRLPERRCRTAPRERGREGPAEGVGGCGRGAGLTDRGGPGRTHACTADRGQASSSHGQGAEPGVRGQPVGATHWACLVGGLPDNRS